MISSTNSLIFFFTGFSVLRSGFILFSYFAVNELFPAAQEAIGLQRMQDWVQCASAELISMPPQLGDDPKPVNGLFGGVMQDMDFNKTEEKVPQHNVILVIISDFVIDSQYSKQNSSCQVFFASVLFLIQNFALDPNIDKNGKTVNLSFDRAQHDIWPSIALLQQRAIHTHEDNRASACASFWLKIW
jgi:hypothetical protein